MSNSEDTAVDGEIDDRRGNPRGALTVMTANVRTAAALDLLHPWIRRRRAFAQVIQDCRPDICALQEPTAGQLGWLRDRLDGFEVHAEGRRGDGRGEHGALLVRPSALEVESSRACWFSDTPDEAGSRSWGNRYPRFALLATCRVVATGHRLVAVGLHLDHLSGRSRRRSAEALVEWLGDSDVRSWVVMGDFNTTPDDEALQPLWDVGLVDVLAHLPAKGPGAGTFHGYRGHDRGKRIDHVLVSPDWQVAAAAVVRDRPGGRLASDHWPVSARLICPGEGNGPARGSAIRRR